MKRYLIGFAALSIVGCGAPVMLDPQEQQKDPNTIPKRVDYPAGPYGYYIGGVMADVALTGQTDDNGSGLIDAGDAIRSIRMSDYYNNKQYKALFIGVAAEWCGPCKIEQPTLVQVYNEYGGKDGNVAFLEAMIQNVQGGPADITVVDRWAKTYKIPFHMAADPTVALGPYYNQAAFPMQMIVDLKTMTIVYQNNGSGPQLESDLKAQFDDIIANNP